MIATFVSAGNECAFCCASHRAVAAQHLGGDYALVDAVKRDPGAAPISAKLKALLAIADRVRVDAKQLSSEDVDAARRVGATDLEIHDTVLIAAAFCMFNRYVDGLATWTPDDSRAYDEMGRRIAEEGYLRQTSPQPAAAGLDAERRR
jgi:uncharacterized peroxidase-related enzyme